QLTANGTTTAPPPTTAHTTTTAPPPTTSTNSTTAASTASTATTRTSAATTAQSTRYDLMRYKCSVPFHHAGKTHTECQPLQLEPLARRIFWCSLVPSISSVTWANLGTDWTFCEAANATGPDYLKSVAGYRSQADAQIHGNHGNKNDTTMAKLIEHAVQQAGDSKSASSDGDSTGSGGAAAATPSSVLGVALGIVGLILAAVAVAAAFAVHRRNQYKRIDPLLSSEQGADKSSYGGMQAYHD
uniref:Fibronectin type-II domain-containing protein n=1 Tax=Macrostomum lignano TaxID=282301 RepID=A0A1I8GRR5_9PLAT